MAYRMVDTRVNIECAEVYYLYVYVYLSIDPTHTPHSVYTGGDPYIG